MPYGAIQRHDGRDGPVYFFCAFLFVRLDVTARISFGTPLIQLYENGRLLGQRDYSSPKRAMNAIREIIRCAGYTFSIHPPRKGLFSCPQKGGRIGKPHS